MQYNWYTQFLTNLFGLMVIVLIITGKNIHKLPNKFVFFIKLINNKWTFLTLIEIKIVSFFL